MVGRRAFVLAWTCLCALGLGAQNSDDDKKDEVALSASEAALDKGHYLAAQESSRRVRSIRRASPVTAWPI